MRTQTEIGETTSSRVCAFPYCSSGVGCGAAGQVGEKTKRPVKLGAGTAVLCPYEGEEKSSESVTRQLSGQASDVASECEAGVELGGGDGGSGGVSSGEVWSADCSWEVRMVWRQELAP